MKIYFKVDSIEIVDKIKIEDIEIKHEVSKEELEYTLSEVSKQMPKVRALFTEANLTKKAKWIADDVISDSLRLDTLKTMKANKDFTFQTEEEIDSEIKRLEERIGKQKQRLEKINDYFAGEQKDQCNI